MKPSFTKALPSIVLLLALIFGALGVTPAHATTTLFISEVAPWSSGIAPLSSDWFEVTNTGASAVNITGWKVDDNSNSFAVSVALNGITSIAPGESVIFIENATPATAISNFKSAWFNGNAPAGLQIGTYTGSGIGLSSSGDAVNLFDSGGVLQANVVFGASAATAPFKSFDNAAALNNTTISQLSADGTNGAFVALNDSTQTGSPGAIANPATPTPTVTSTSTETLTPTDTPVYTSTATETATDTLTPTNTLAPTQTQTSTPVSFTGIDLSTYVRTGRYNLPEPTRTTPPANSLLAQEASAVTYNWDTDTLFVVGDGSTSVVQISKTGQLIDSMTLATGSSPQGTEFYDTEGLTYVGNGKFVMVEERDRQVNLFTYVAGTTLTRSAVQTVKLGTSVGNIGIEGLSYDPQTGGFIPVKEISPEGIFQTGIDFDAGTATNGSPSTVNSIDLFNPALANLADFADVFALSNLPALNTYPDSSHLLLLSQESGKVVNIDRSGVISNSLTIVSDPGNPLSLPDQQHEGLTMDRDGVLYIVSENGGGDFDHPQLWVYQHSAAPNLAPSAVALNNSVTSIVENSSTASPVKVADILVTDDGLGTNTLTVTGVDAASFEIIGSELFIKAGTTLDYETQTSYSITVNVDDLSVGSTPDATVNYSLTVTDVTNETPSGPTLIISEVAPWSSGSSPNVLADWFEVTNTGNSAVDITGWRVDDSSASFGLSLALSGITSIAAGESVIFIETNDLPGKTTAFKSNWFGANPPAGLQIGNYTGGGIGLSSSGDAVNLFDSSGVVQASVTFGASPAGPSFATFNNAAGLNNAAITQLSAVGVNSAFAAVNAATEVGSPGTIGKTIISEVAPWSSGNSPVAADWFEVTNTRATALDITGWKVDDSSGSFAASLTLNGITSIAAGESVIFIETNDLPGKTTLFKSNWFGGNPPAGLQIGNYTGASIGLSSSGDAVNLYDGSGALQASVTFGASPAGPSFATFDNAAGLNSTTISLLSVNGVNGALVAVNSSNEVGSPGTIVNAPAATPTPTATITSTPTITNTPIFTATPSATGTMIPTPTNTVEASPTVTSTPIATSTPMDTPVASTDNYTTQMDTTLNVNVAQGLLSNDTGSPLNVVSNTSPAHGTLTLNQDGSFTYIPASGYTGPDSFSYSISNAVQLYSTNLSPLGTFGGVSIDASGYGSAIAPVPGSSDEIYGLTDRGPNVDGPGGTKIEPIPSFAPAIGKFKLIGGQAVLEQIIPLQDASGNPFNGRVNPNATTGETITDLNGTVLGTDVNGYDSEGLVALPDGTFWVSDEYGPFITHFDATGKEIERVSPYNSSLPGELSKRVVNRGMEGLTITPDGTTLVGIMQSALQQTDLAGFDAKKIVPIRVVTYKLSNGETHEYLYLLDNPSSTKTSASEITALSNTTFLVDERDGNFLPGGYKKLYRIDISSATDVGPASAVAGASYAAASGGLLIGGQSIELLVKNMNTSTSTTTLAANGITPVSKTLHLDLGAMLIGLNAQARFFAHDKIEGVIALNGGSQLIISNDSDFGIDGVTNASAPFLLHAKTIPATGKQDFGEYLMVDLGRLPAVLSSATVNITVLPAPTATATATATETFTPTPSSTATVTEAATFTATSTSTATATATETFTPTPSSTATFTATATRTPTKTATPVTITLNSIGAQDGWVLETSENSSAGGTLNSMGSTFSLGDDTAKRQYRGVLSFNTGAGIPDTAIITAVTLKVKQQAILGGGSPVSIFQGFMADIKNGFFGTAVRLQTTDFQATGSGMVGPFVTAPVNSIYTINLTNGKAFINKLATSNGLTQIRLRFKLDDNNNAIANYLSLYSGNAASAADRPQLVITYKLP